MTPKNLTGIVLFMARDYQQEYRSYHGSPLQIKRRAQRNGARAKVKKKAGAKAVAGKDVHHKARNKRGNLNNSMSNLAIKSKSANRSRNS